MNEKAIGYGVTGWKSRQEVSRHRMSKGSEERAEIRAIRKQHKLDLKAGAKPEPVEPANPEQLNVVIVPHQKGWYTVEVNGVSVMEGKVRKAEAEQIAKDFSDG